MTRQRQPTRAEIDLWRRAMGEAEPLGEHLTGHQWTGRKEMSGGPSFLVDGDRFGGRLPRS